ncbi:HAMP domain-containing protein [Fulvivirgaceae bacterium PWU5]|uniref:histidine kinase n=1 Tax=Dawidia cretensis TaxID=2782350 RepID=A0AAP2DW82_9BACT|nr:ATP-binding protein [Dawidia cretensis]MBT1708396.1 HAMP domain-containing protein [Dawidia cretensis]
MNIRSRLTLLFFSLVIVVLSAICLSVYVLSDNYREEDFYRRLRNRAVNTAKILTEVKEVDATLLRRMEQNNPASLPNQYIIIYDDHGEEVYRSGGVPPVEIEADILEQAKAKMEVSFQKNNTEGCAFIFDNVGKAYTIVAIATDIYGRDALQNLRNVLTGTFCISVILVSILGWLYAGRVLRPISRIVNQVSHITEVNLNQRLDEGNKRDELSKLSQTFNRMLGRLQSAFTSQKNFIANASHEIKTPITAMSAEIEVSLLQQRDPTYYIEVLRSIRAGLRGLNDISTRLLILAQTSVEQPEMNFSVLRIDDLLWDVKEELLKAYSDYSINIELDLELQSDALAIEGDEQLMKVVILNLVDNGCKYSPNHRIDIKLASADGSSLVVKFENAGGIPADQLPRIFEPFFRGRNHRQVKGSGIGLSLVSRIVAIHGGTISVNSTAESTEFVLRLPVPNQAG